MKIECKEIQLKTIKDFSWDMGNVIERKKKKKKEKNKKKK